MTGTVADASGQVIVGAEVTIISERAGEERRATTNETGDFAVPALMPGPYTIRVTFAGMRPLERKNNVVTASQRLSVGTLQLEVGSVTESITVTAQGVQVQTGSAETAALIDTKQIAMISIRGRDPIGMLRILPGVQQRADLPEVLGGNFGTNLPTFQGLGTTQTTIMTDGVNGGDSGSGGNFSGTVNIDAIAEMKVQLSNYSAEYGRSGGALINVITKSGGSQFHGSGYWFKRHEQFNANDFFRNRDGIAKPIYRYSTLGATIGGPVPVSIPVLNPGGKKMFFFYSIDDTQLRDPTATERWTMPTVLEKQGNFSQSRNLTGSLIAVRDPLTNAPFPGNIIPANRADPTGGAIMNILPNPNFDGAGFNYLYQEGSLNRPRRQHLFKVDLRPTDSDTFSFKGSTWKAESLGHHVAAATSLWGLHRQYYTFTSDQMAVSYTKIISPRMVNEFNIGVFHSTEDGRTESEQELQRIQRQFRGLGNLGQFAPRNNPLNIIPKATFGGIPTSNTAAAISYDNRLPLVGADTALNGSNNLTYTRGAHIFKMGVFGEMSRFGQGRASVFAGEFNFQNDANDPGNTNYAFANAFIGHYRQYTEGLGRPGNNERRNFAAWFVQDTWKVNRRLTLDIGLRMYKTGWSLNSTGESSAFSFERYDPRSAPVLYRPITSGGARRGVNPLTGEIVPAAYIGAFVPGTGGPVCGDIKPDTPCKVNGVVVQNEATLIPGVKGFREPLPVQFDPRLGIAWDVFGNGKTAIRTSFGTFHVASTGSANVSYFAGPAYRYDQVLYYGEINSLLSTRGLSFPVDVQGPARQQKLPLVYHYSFGIQQDVGFKTVLDVAYVGNSSRHNNQNWNFNRLPYGTRFKPENRDTTTASSPLPDNFLRPFGGFQNLEIGAPATSTRYDSLQVQVNRRFTGGVELSGAYTWSRAFENRWMQELPSSLARRLRSEDQTHILNISYLVDVPRGSKLIPGRASKWVLDNWQISGITTFASGFPRDVVLETVDNFDFAGSSDLYDANRITNRENDVVARGGVVITGPANLPQGSRTAERWFDTSVFKRPSGRGDLGNDFTQNKFRGPGFNNFDLSIFKNVPVGSESRNLQLRWEFYNLFNHTQFNVVNATARFDAAGNQVNTQFARATSARPERRMQVSLRFQF